METKNKIFLVLAVSFLLTGLASFWLVPNVQALQYPLIPNGSTGTATCAANNYGSCTNVQRLISGVWTGTGNCGLVRNSYPNYRAVCNESAPVVNGACGLNATNYSASETSYPDIFCNTGTASPISPAFPAQGGSTTWSCLGSGGGTNASCTATRDAAACTPSWSCTGWSTCSGGTQTRTCIDDNACGTAAGKPAESQTCTVPFDYSLSTSGNISVIRGGSSGSNTITVSKSAGSAQSVSLSVSGLPQSTASFSSTSCTPDSICTSTLTISVPLTATGGQTQTGTHTITVTGSPLSKTTTFNLVVSDPLAYSLSNNGNISVVRGSSGSNTITVELTGGVEQDISLSASGLPFQSIASFLSSSCTPNITCTSTLTISTGAQTPTGTHTITVSGSPASGTTSFTLTVNEPSPPPPVPTNMRVTTSTPIIKGTTVNFGWDASAGATYYLVQFYRDSVGTGTWVIPEPVIATNISYTDTAGLNTIGALVKACKTGNNCSAVTGVTATLTDPPTADIKASPTVSGTYSDGPINIAYNNAAYLKWSSANAASCSISPAIAGATIGTSNSTGLSTNNLTSNTTYTLTCGGATDTVTVNVAAPTLSTVLTPNPTTGTGDTSVTLSATAGGTAIGTINYSFWWNCDNTSNIMTTVETACGALQMPTAPLLCASNANGYKCNGVTANPQAASAHTYTPGNYTSKVIVERGAATPAENRQAVAIATPFTYTLANSGNKTVNKGSSVTNTITVTKNTGTAEAVTLRTALPLPTGVTASFNPASCSPQPTEYICTSVLTLTAGSTATVGTYTIQVSGSPASGTTSFDLIVQNPPASLTASCSADKTKATLKESVTWTAVASGGGTYAYLWGGTTPLATAIINPKTVAYTATGNKTGRVTVTSGGQSVVADCSNSVDAYMPKLKVEPSSVGGADDEFKVAQTRQLAVDYYPHGLANTDTKQDITASASWSSSRSNIARVNNTSPNKGLLTGVAVGTANIAANYTDPFGNITYTTIVSGTSAAVTVTRPDELTVSIKTHPNSPGDILTNQDITFEATGGIGGYTWSGGGTPATDNTGQSQFITKYTTAGSKTVRVVSGSQHVDSTFTVAQPTLSIDSLAASPASGKAALDVSLTANTTSNIEGTSNYTFWWNCNNSGTSVSAVKLICGDPADSAIGAKFDGVAEENKSTSHIYSTSGDYTAKVIVERGDASAQQMRTPISAGKIDIKAQASDGPVTLDADTSTTVSWTSENVTSCTASGTGPNWSGAKQVSGADSTGVLSQPGDYRYTLTCAGSNGLSISDYVDITVVNTLRIDSFTVVPPGKNTGSASEVRASVSSNITGVTNNYTFYCSRSTPDSDTTVAAGWDHKRDGVAEMSYQADDLCNYNYFAPGAYTAKVIVERGGLARAAHVDIVIPVNVAPTVSPIAPAAPANYCASPFGWVLKWNFSDAGGDSQYSYRVVVNDAATATVVSDSGEVISSSNSYAIPLGVLGFNKTYNWAVRVWESDAARLSAVEIGPSFTTIAHAAPALSFNLSPARPSRDEQVTLTDTTVVSGGATKTNWNWDFTGVDGVTLLTPTNGSQAVVKFSTSGSKNVKLRITDSDGLSCQKGANDDANDSLPNITVGRSIPLFKEILPR